MFKKLFALPLAFILAIFMTQNYFQAKFPFTHDGENHLARFANYKVAIREGQFPPRFAPNLLNHYGYPVFNYNYPLANLLSLPFSLIKISYELTFKFLSVFFVLAGLVGVYYYLDKLKIQYRGAAAGLLTLASTPFIFSTLVYRGNIGEIMAWGLWPWLLEIIESIRNESNSEKISPKEYHFLLRSLIWTAFFLSHNISAVFGLGIALIYAGIRYQKNWARWRELLKVVGLGIGGSLWFWLPALAEMSLVNVGQVDLVTNFSQHFPTLRQLFFSPLEFGFSYPGSVDSLSFQLGSGQVLSLSLGLLLAGKMYLQQRKKTLRDADKKKLPLLLWTIGAIILLIIFQIPLSKPIWQLFSGLAFIQFTWRLSLFIGVFFSLLVGLMWEYLRWSLKLILTLVFIVQLTHFSQLKSADYFHKNKIDYDAFSQTTTTNNENLTPEFTYQAIHDWQPSPTIIQGEGEIDVVSWNGSQREYRVTSKEEVIVAEPTMNFAGWQTFITSLGSEENEDSKPTRIEYLDTNQTQGRIAYFLKGAGKYAVKTRFTQKTLPRIIGNTISGLTLLGLLFFFFKDKFKFRKSFYLSWKAGLFFLSFMAGAFLLYDPSFPYATSLLAKSGLPRWLYSWANFDGVHYLTIAEKGYMGTGLIQAFFPLFPKLLSVFSGTKAQIIWGLLLNTLFGWWLLKIWQKTISKELGATYQKVGTLVLFLFPTALFFNALYTETLFLWLVLLSLYQAREKRWFLAGLVAALASATRVTGIFLVPALLVELWLQKRASGQAWGQIVSKSKKEIFYISLGGLGLLGYMIYLGKTFGDPLYFYHVQSEFGGGRQESLITYPQVVWRYLKILWTARPFDFKYYAYFQEFLFGVLGAIGIVWSWFKIRKSYVVFSVLAFILPTLTGTFSSLPRYFLGSFSVLLLLTQLIGGSGVERAEGVERSKRRGWRISYFILSGGLLIINTILFIQGYWVS